MRFSRFFLLEKQLYIQWYNGIPLRCLHLNKIKKANQLMTPGYYWPTMENDSATFVRKCKTCQLYGNLIHVLSVELHSLSTPYPFHMWAFDLIGKITPLAWDKMWILVATELYTKWAEVIPLRKVTALIIVNFIREHIICRFGIIKLIIS